MQYANFTHIANSVLTSPKKHILPSLQIEDFITEFAGIMGEHFNDLGAKKENEEKKAAEQQQAMGPDIGPLAEQALKRQKEREAKGEVGWDDSASQADVDKIIGNQVRQGRVRGAKDDLTPF